MAKPPMTNQLRRIKGEKDKTRFLPEGITIIPLTELPEPPQWWKIEVVNYYEEIGNDLLAHGMLGSLDVQYLGLYCHLLNKVNRSWMNDDTPPMAMYTQLNSFAAHLGVNPVGRQKFQAPPTGKTKNKFSK